MKAPSAKSCPSCNERYDPDVLYCPKDGTPLASQRSPSFNPTDRDTYLGIELAGQIQLKHLIGIGSMGRVYRAHQGGIERDVAVKILHRELSGNPELVNRFHREAKVASRLIHPNVVQVLMTGTVPFQADPHIGGELYLVMEHLDGISLLSALAAAGTEGEGAALPLPRAIHLVLQICDAVGEAHAQGIVHRDLKPENVMLVRRGDDPDYVKVLDFGIARLDWGDRSMATTQAGLIFGTAKYISPEGAEGLPVTPAADVYALATILYQCLAGRTPFEGDSPVALLVQHTHAPPADLRSVARASYVPAPLAALIMQNLAKKPSERAPNARLFGRELVAAARASGLYPEEIATQATLFSPASAVKLASKERTKSLELSPSLAARIGGVAAARAAERDDEAPSEPEVRPPHSLRGAPSEPAPRPSARAGAAEPAPASGWPRGSTTEIREGGAVPYTPPPRTLIEGPAESASPPRATSRPSAPRSSSGPGHSARPPQLDFEDEGSPPRRRAPEPADLLDAGGPPASTMQGTETTLGSSPSPSRRRSRVARIALIAGCALIAAPAVILGGRKLGGFGASASGDSLDADLAEARECMSRHAWDTPAQHNLKEITDRDRARYPDDARVQDLRREASERLLSDALGRKYSADVAGALHLARLAVELNPELTPAQHLLLDLQGGGGPAVAPAPDAGAPAVPGPTGGRTPIRRSAKDPRAPASGAAAPAPPAPSGDPGPVLPPQPPPLPPDHTVPPAPSSTGPWL